MQKFRKFTIIATAVALVAVLLVAPTLAWLFSTSEKVVNTFESGDISIVLDETPVDPDGTPQPGPRVTENTYKFVAGSELDKDPTPTVKKGTINSYLFVNVENKYSDIFSTNVDAAKWLKVAEDNGKTLYVYYKKVAAPDADVTLDPVFTKVKVSEELTLDRLHEIKETDEKQFINAQCYAIQADVIAKNKAFDMAAEQFAYADSVQLNYVDVA